MIKPAGLGANNVNPINSSSTGKELKARGVIALIRLGITNATKINSTAASFKPIFMRCPTLLFILFFAQYIDQ